MDTQTANTVTAELISLEQSLSTFDNTTRITQDARQAMLTKFLPELMSFDMRMDDKTDAEQHEAKSRFVSEMRGLLNDMDNAARRHTETKLKQKDLEMAQANNINAAELLSRIKIGSMVITPKPTETMDDIDAKLRDRFAATGDDIPDTELETGNTALPEKKTDSDSL